MKKQKKWMASKGMKTITLKGADRQKWSATSKKTGWAQVIKLSPKHGPALKKLFSK